MVKRGEAEISEAEINQAGEASGFNFLLGRVLELQFRFTDICAL